MTEPQTEYETDKTDPLYPFIKRGIFTGFDEFDQVYKPSKKAYRQFYSNLPAIEDDFKNFKKLLINFEFSPNEIEIFVRKKFSELGGMFMRLTKLLRDNPHQTVLIFSCYSSHGMIQDGRQVILVNEFDSNKGFYRLFAAE